MISLSDKSYWIMLESKTSALGSLVKGLPCRWEELCWPVAVRIVCATQSVQTGFFSRHDGQPTGICILTKSWLPRPEGLTEAMEVSALGFPYDTS